MGSGSVERDDRMPEPPAARADAELAARTQGVYERQARRFDAERPRSLHERAWLDRFLELVEPEGRILDLGCGAGEPIAAYFTAGGYRVIGLDASREMLALAENRFPDGDWRRGDMRQLDLEETFDGIIAWNSFFHLMPAEQRDVLQRIGRHLREGAALMLTVGDRAGEVGGWVGGEAVYHSSLAPEEYEGLLHDLGVDVVAFVREDPECDGQTILLGRKNRE